MEFKDFYTKRYQGKKLAILGFGREGQSSYHWLRQMGVTDTLTIIDENLEVVQNWLAEHPTEVVALRQFQPEQVLELNQFDLIFRTPGFSRTKILGVDAQRLTSQTNELLLTQAHRTIAITGTKGKSTTSSLTAAVLTRLGVKVQLVGNIGQPALDMLLQDDGEGWFVYEMSSYQAENITVAPAIGVVINLFEEHLDHYVDFADYISAKLNLITLPGQRLAIYGSDNQLLKQSRSQIQAEKVRSFGLKTNRLEQESGIYLDTDAQQIVRCDANGEQVLMPADFPRQLRGQHNLLNSLVALLVADEVVGLTTENIALAQSAIAEFVGLEHRLEYVGKFRGIDFYNDSISTIPEAMERAIEAIANVQTVIVGGQDRGIHREGMIEYLNQRPHLKLICLPDTGHQIFDRLTNEKYRVENLEQAVKIAYQVTDAGQACVLSPASPSYTFFKNFEERGQIFKQQVVDQARQLEKPL
jgi:UDP-N-acetylmuramoyl-L-alanine--D-glutamate ligase